MAASNASVGDRPRRLRHVRRTKASVIVDDIVAQVADGDLAPGDRLASNKVLGESYGVSQGVVVQAIAELVERGIVVTRRRSGCYVAEAASGVLRESTRRTASNVTLDNFLTPRSAKESLCVYVSDILPQNLTAWRQVLAEFLSVDGAVGIELVTCADGHLEDVIQERRVDLVQTTPAILAEVPGFVGPPTLDMVGVDHKDLLPVVRTWCDRSPNHGVPFSLTVHYLFANLDLLRRAGVSEDPPTTWFELFARAKQVGEQLGAQDIAGIRLAELADWLMLSGAVRREGDRVSFNPQTATDLFAGCVEARLPSTVPGDTVPPFRAGTSAYLHHCSWEAVDLQDVPFSWAAWPLPIASGVDLPGTLTVLAMNRETAIPQTCLDLMSHLCSAPAQRVFGQLGGNLSVLRGVSLDDGLLAVHPVDAETVRRAVDYTMFLSSDDYPTKLQRCAKVPWPLLSGTSSVPEAVSRVQFALELAFPDLEIA